MIRGPPGPLRRQGIDEAGAKSVIYAYNHSNLYVLAVWTVAEKLKAMR